MIKKVIETSPFCFLPIVVYLYSKIEFIPGKVKSSACFLLEGHWA